MILPDVNILLYAFRADAPDHATHGEWLSSVVNGEAAYWMSPQALAGVMRIATHPKNLQQPQPAH